MIDRDKLGEGVDAKVEIERIKNELIYLRNAALVQGEMDVAVYLSHAIRALSLCLGVEDGT